MNQLPTGLTGEAEADGGARRSDRYPDYLMPLAGSLPQRDQLFEDLREQLLLNFGYNTARAYWGDLEHVHDWATERGLDVLTLSEDDVRTYLALLRRRQYSENTLRRRVTALRAFYRPLCVDELDHGNPARTIVVRRRRRSV